MRSDRVVPIALVAGAFLTFVILVAAYIDTPLRFDEVEWPIQIAGMLRHGTPQVLASEAKTQWPLAPPPPPIRYGMWHPPLYQYSLAAAARMGGFSNWVLRGHSLLWFVGSLALCWMILGKILPAGSSRLARATPLGLILLSPLLAESSLHLDIDNTALTFFLLLFGYLLVRQGARPFPIATAAQAGGAFGLTLLTKLTSPFLVLPAVGVYLWRQHGFRRALVVASTIVLVGCSGFVIFYLLYCWLLDYPWRFMFEVSYLSGKTGPARHLWTVAQSVRWHLLWISPGIVFLLATAALVRARSVLATRSLLPGDLLALCGISILTPYVAWAGFFGKYTVPAVILLILGLSPTIVAALNAERNGTPSDGTSLRRLLLIAVPVLAVQAFLLAPLQLRPPSSGVVSLGWYESIIDRRNGLLLLAVGSLALVAAAAARSYPQRPVHSRLLLAGLLYVALANPANILKTVLSDRDRSPYRPFLDTGFASTVAFLNSHLPEETIVAPKDLGYYYDGLHFPIESIEGLYGIDALRDLIRSGRATVFVDSLADPASPRARDSLSPDLQTIDCGDFSIRWLRHASPASAVPATCPETGLGARTSDPLRALTKTDDGVGG